MDRSHYCFTCGKVCSAEELDCCNELVHDIDSDDLYSPPNNETQQYQDTKDDKTKLLEFALKNIQKVFVSSSDSSQFYGLVDIDGHKETINLNSNHAISWLKVLYFWAILKFLF